MPFCAVLSDQHQSQDVATQPNQAINASAQALRHAAAVADLQKVQELCRKSVPFDADVVRAFLTFMSLFGTCFDAKPKIICAK